MKNKKQNLLWILWYGCEHFSQLNSRPYSGFGMTALKKKDLKTFLSLLKPLGIEKNCSFYKKKKREKDVNPTKLLRQMLKLWTDIAKDKNPLDTLSNN